MCLSPMVTSAAHKSAGKNEQVRVHWLVWYHDAIVNLLGTGFCSSCLGEVGIIQEHEDILGKLWLIEYRNLQINSPSLSSGQMVQESNKTSGKVSFNKSSKECLSQYCSQFSEALYNFDSLSFPFSLASAFLKLYFQIICLSFLPGFILLCFDDLHCDTC